MVKKYEQDLNTLEEMEKSSGLDFSIEKSQNQHTRVSSTGKVFSAGSGAKQDTTHMFQEYVSRKTEFDSVQSLPSNLGEEEVNALAKIYKKHFKALPPTASYADVLFNRQTPSGSTQYIVKRDKEYFYVDTQGYDYARYTAKIPNSVMFKIKKQNNEVSTSQYKLATREEIDNIPAEKETEFNAQGRRVVEGMINSVDEKIEGYLKGFKDTLDKQGDGFMNPSYKHQLKKRIDRAINTHLGL